MLRQFMVLPMLVLGANAALAQDDPTCRGGLFTDDTQFALATVGGKSRAYFYDDNDGCPVTDSAKCRTSSYLVPGDTVVISRIRTKFACAFFPNDKGGTAGWIETRQLLLQPRDTREMPKAWLGGWNNSGNPQIRISKDLGALRVDGEAYWPGPPGTHDWPSTHIGEIGGRVELTGNKGFYEDENLCEIRFTLLGDYLVAHDNRQCGGANVSFSGVYVRR